MILRLWPVSLQEDVRLSRLPLEFLASPVIVQGLREESREIFRAPTFPA